MFQRKKLCVAFVVAGVLLMLLVAWIARENAALEVNTICISSDDIPKDFNGFRIAHISDLHNAEIGEDNADLLKMLCDSDPDIIAITGDLIDSRNTNLKIALDFVRLAVEIAPCYYVTGNHEARIAEYDTFRAELIGMGVTILENKRVFLERADSKITLIGLNDPSFSTDYLFGESESVMDAQLKDLMGTDTSYCILLSHRPELFDSYIAHGVDLTLSGHAHGGQFRIPYIGGMFAPNQGLFPAYDSGRYTKESSTLIVSRGIGNSIIPFRINNPPEIILIELRSEEN